MLRASAVFVAVKLVDLMELVGTDIVGSDPSLLRTSDESTDGSRLFLPFDNLNDSVFCLDYLPHGEGRC